MLRFHRRWSGQQETEERGRKGLGRDCTLGDFFGARSCGAPFSGMNMDTNWSKSARATTHPPRTARAWCRIIQLTTNWHAFPVLPPLNDTEIEKKHHHYTAFRSLFTFSPKIRGTNPNTRYAKKKQGMMGVGNSRHSDSMESQLHGTPLELHCNCLREVVCAKLGAYVGTIRHEF